jgi:hypothetical protein
MTNGSGKRSGMTNGRGGMTNGSGKRGGAVMNGSGKRSDGMTTEE